MKQISPAGNRTRVTRVTGGYTNLYTTEDLYSCCRKHLSGRNRTSDPVIADIYSHMLYQLSYAE